MVLVRIRSAFRGTTVDCREDRTLGESEPVGSSLAKFHEDYIYIALQKCAEEPSPHADGRGDHFVNTLCFVVFVLGTITT